MARLLADAQDKNANETLEQLAVPFRLLCLRVVVVVSLTAKGGGSCVYRVGGFANVHLRFPELGPGGGGGQSGGSGKRAIFANLLPFSLFPQDYCASKFGAIGFHESLSHELKASEKDGINMTLVCPYLVDTGMFKGCRIR